MAIILKAVGPDKVKVIKVYKDLMGVGLADAKEAINSVEAGNELTIHDIDNEQEAVFVFSQAGAYVIASSTVNNYEKAMRELEKSEEVEETEKTQEVKETKETEGTEETENVEEKVENETDDKVGEVLTVKSNYDSEIDLSSMGREETLNLLAEVKQIISALEEYTEKIEAIDLKLSENEKKANELRNHVSGGTYALICLISFGIAIVGACFLSIFGFIIFGVIGFAIVCTIMSEDYLKKHKAENDAAADEFLRNNSDPLLPQRDELHSELENLKESGSLDWALDIVGEEMFSSSAVEEVYGLIKGRRADNLKEALNLYDSTKYRERMEAMQSAIKDASEIAAAEAVKQTSTMTEIEKSSHQAANAAKINAAINYGTYRNTKKISKNTKK